MENSSIVALQIKLALIALTGLPLAGSQVNLIPRPRLVELGRGSARFHLPLKVGLAGADEQAAQPLLEEFGASGVALESERPDVVLGRLGDPRVEQALNGLNVDREPLRHPESYLLAVRNGRAVVASNSAPGLFYGAETLRQLLRREENSLQAPEITITDWPALRYRGIFLDIGRGAIPTEEHFERIIRTAAEFKLNLIGLYMQHLFDFGHAPGVAPEDGRLTPEFLSRLVRYAARHHIQIVPEQQTFGHLHPMLKLELYSGMAEVPHGSVLAEDERGYEWIRKAGIELSEVFTGEFLHIGSDETFELGSGRSRSLSEKLGPGGLYFHHLGRVAELLRPLNKRLMFWGDIAMNHPELVSQLPKDMIAMAWQYNIRPDYMPWIEPFRKAGMKFMVCPGVSNWNRIFPDIGGARKNIDGFARAGKENGALGLMNTFWLDDGESLLSAAWNGIVYGAAAAWQPGGMCDREFDEAFDWAFYRAHGNALSGAIAKLNGVHASFRAAGIGDANDELCWFDPFSRYGAERVRKGVRGASEARRLAEQAYVELSQHRGSARRNAGTLDVLRFAAKRLDYVGMKIQFTKEIADLYRDSFAHQEDGQRFILNHIQISSVNTNGRVEDLRDAINDLKETYRRLWLSENRPYYLNNVLVRYDSEALYWQRLARLCVRIRDQYAAEKRLPPPEEIGLVLP